MAEHWKKRHGRGEIVEIRQVIEDRVEVEDSFMDMAAFNDLQESLDNTAASSIAGQRVPAILSLLEFDNDGPDINVLYRKPATITSSISIRSSSDSLHSTTTRQHDPLHSTQATTGSYAHASTFSNPTTTSQVSISSTIE
ncbi:unnamed protein product [Orchesella dallaii]|uniref:Uncharacterized protein n=1 Tax=Orchesella dallaii TaxID=48710 RepID=A0ABP1RW23_9HEXA